VGYAYFYDKWWSIVSGAAVILLDPDTNIGLQQKVVCVKDRECICTTASFIFMPLCNMVF